MKIKKNAACEVQFHGRGYPCPVSMVMDLLGGKWRGVILYHLKEKPMRFSEIKKCIPHITEMTLSLQLKKLENDGVILKEVLGGKPPLKVTYMLSEFGITLKPILDAVQVWTENEIVCD